MSSQQWYLAIGGHQVGPVSEEEVAASLKSGTADGKTLVFTAGMSNWTPLEQVPQLARYLGGGVAVLPPIVPGRRSRTRSTSRSTAPRCSSSRCTWIRARAPWPRPAR